MSALASLRAAVSPAAETKSQAPSRLGFLAAVACILTAGLALRLAFVLRADFPLHDGGLFYVMIRDLQQNHYALPWFTSYNLDRIPYAYPPLAFYVTGAIQQFTTLNLFDLFRFLPMLFSLCTALAVLLLARALGFSATGQLLSLLAFLLLPETSYWLIMGGGITRSLGLLFAVLAIASGYLAFTKGQQRYVAFAVLASTGAVLTHLEMAWFAFYSLGLVFVFFGRSRRGLGSSLVIMFGTLLLTSAWWLTVLFRHGLTTFVMSVSGSQSQWPMLLGIGQLLVGPSRELLFPLIGTVAFVGAGLCVKERAFFLPIWVVLVFALQPRGPLAKAAVPLALLAAIGVEQSIDLLAKQGTTGRFPNYVRPILASIVLMFLVLSVYVGAGNLLDGLSREEREAMRWMTEQTPEKSRVLVMPSDSWWGTDRSSEWFPALTQRVSVAAVQGYEFMPGNGFAQRVELNDAVRECVYLADAACIDEWSTENSVDYEYVYVPKRPAIAITMPPFNKDCCGGLRRSLEKALNYQKAFENAGAVIFQRVASAR